MTWRYCLKPHELRLPWGCPWMHWPDDPALRFTIGVLRKPRGTLAPEEQVQQQRQHHAHHHRRHDREVEREVLPPDDDVARQPSEPGHAAREQQERTDRRDHDAEHDERATDLLHAAQTARSRNVALQELALRRRGLPGATP